MSFLKDLRRRSKASFRSRERDQNQQHQQQRHNDAASNQSGKSNRTVTTKSSSTLGSAATNSPATAPSLQSSSSNLTLSKLNGGASSSGTAPPPQRPSPMPAQSKRYSTTGSYSESMRGNHGMPRSLYAPIVFSISENTWVNQRVFFIHGVCGQDQRPLDGTLIVHHHQNCFPSTEWPVCASHFKALVYLNPGPNELRFDFSSPKLVGSTANPSSTQHTSNFRINFLPTTTTPPLNLVILKGKDSNGTYDAPPEKIQREENDTATAVSKYRMAATLWQAFTSECMFRNHFGRRCFRFEEEWQQGTMSRRDKDNRQMRSETKVHVVQSEMTVAEIRAVAAAAAAAKGGSSEEPEREALYDLVSRDLRRTLFADSPYGLKHHVAVMLLDSHWDVGSQTLQGHAAIAEGDRDIRMGIFGSHALHSYPTSLEDVVPALTDCTRTNTQYVAAEGGENSGTFWQAACYGIGGHLQEIGRMFGLPNQASGIMSKDYAMLNRTFVMREPYSTKTKQQGIQPCLAQHETSWHRLDILRLRSHPCLRLVTDQYVPVLASPTPEDGVQVWPTDQSVVLMARSGISFVEIRAFDKSASSTSLNSENVPCEAWVEYHETSEGYPRQVALSEAELRSRLAPELRSKSRLRVDAYSHAGGRAVIEDYGGALSKSTKIKIPRGPVGYIGPRFGSFTANNLTLQVSSPRSERGRGKGKEKDWGGQGEQQLILDSIVDQRKLLTCINVFYSRSLIGLEFCYEDSTSQLFGRKEEQFGVGQVNFDIRRGEVLSGFYLRASNVVYGIEILTSLGRRTGVFGNPAGGQGYNLMPPRGYRIAGLWGSSNACIDGFALIIAR